MKHYPLVVVAIALFTLLITTVCNIPSKEITDTIVGEAGKFAQTAVQSVEEKSPGEDLSQGKKPTIPVIAATQAMQAPLASCDGSSSAWFGTQNYGLICLDNEGWHVFTEDNSPLSSSYTQDIQICGDGRIYIVSSGGLDSTDGKTWRSYRDQLGYGGVESIACGQNGELWITQYKGAQYFNGSKWTSFTADQFGTGKYVDNVKDITVDHNGDAWLVTSNSIAHFDGNQWTYYEEGKGLNENYYFENIAVDCENNIWASYTDGVVKYHNGNWEAIESRDLFQSKAIAVSPVTCGVWVGTYSRGINFNGGSGWVNYNRKTSAISSEKIKAIAVDGQDRIWIGTEWGLSVFDGNAWTAYHMHNSDLTDNEIVAVAVAGNGPSLPGWYEKSTGQLTGQLIKDDNPISNALVEACTEFIGMIFSGSSPCSDNPLRAEVTTDNQGNFTFTDLPIGRYSLAFQVGDGKWMRLTNSFKIGDKELLVTEGGVTDIGTITIEPE